MWRVVLVNAGMAVSTDYERLSSPPDHKCHPRGHCVLARPDEIGEFSDLVHLHPLRTPAYLAAVQQESADQFLVTDRLGTNERCVRACTRSMRAAFFCRRSGIPP